MKQLQRDPTGVWGTRALRLTLPLTGHASSEDSVIFPENCHSHRAVELTSGFDLVTLSPWPELTGLLGSLTRAGQLDSPFGHLDLGLGDPCLSASCAKRRHRIVGPVEHRSGHADDGCKETKKGTIVLREGDPRSK